MIKRWLLSASFVAISCSPLLAAEQTWTPTLELTPAATSSGWLTSANVSIHFAPPISPEQVKGYSILLDSSPFMEADLIVDTANPAWQFTDLADGTRYFTVHVLQKNGRWIKGKPVRIKVDTTPPPAPGPIVAYDSLFAKTKIAADTAQSLTKRPFFKWKAPKAEPGSSIALYRCTWQKTDSNEVIESTASSATEFFPQQAVAAGRYKLTLTAVDEAGWESTTATFGFVSQ